MPKRNVVVEAIFVMAEPHAWYHQAQWRVPVRDRTWPVYVKGHAVQRVGRSGGDKRDVIPPSVQE
jgi:hypothetical protein